MWSTNNVDSFLLSVFFFLTRLPSPPNYDSTRATFLKWRIYAENRICSMVKVSCDTILSLQLEEKKKEQHRGWFMFRDFRTGSTNSPNTSRCERKVIRLLIVESKRYVNSEFAWRQRMGRGERYGSEFAFEIARKIIETDLLLCLLEKKVFHDDFFSVALNLKLFKIDRFVVRINCCAIDV